jgi:pimeloyl-ACP methyl ester carboxylesterase
MTVFYVYRARGPAVNSILRRHDGFSVSAFEKPALENDDDLTSFEAEGAPALPMATEQGHVTHDGARIWYASFGAGAPVVLLHGGLGHSGNWGHQVTALIAAGRRVIAIDSRGHGRSTRDSRPFKYQLMVSDVLAVMDHLRLDRSAFVGWSDGACIALILAMSAPARATGVFFFACKMDPSGTKEIQPSNLLGRCLNRHAKDYAKLSATPTEFAAFGDAVSLMMETEPNYTAQDLERIRVPVAIVLGEHDEFIKREHAEYLARTIPSAELSILAGVGHFAPLQRPAMFNAAVLAFLNSICR